MQKKTERRYEKEKVSSCTVHEYVIFKEAAERKSFTQNTHAIAVQGHNKQCESVGSYL